MRFDINPAQPLTEQARQFGIERRGSKGPVVLYRFYRASTLLYVGVTGHIPERWQQHKRRAAWWPLLTLVSIEEHPYMNAALDAELAAIRNEHPLYNRRSILTDASVSPQ
jgi:hypothetical protein